MKKLLLIFLVSLFTLSGSAQEEYRKFTHISYSSITNEPKITKFEVVVGKKVYTQPIKKTDTNTDYKYLYYVNIGGANSTNNNTLTMNYVDNNKIVVKAGDTITLNMTCEYNTNSGINTIEGFFDWNHDFIFNSPLNEPTYGEYKQIGFIPNRDTYYTIQTIIIKKDIIIPKDVSVGDIAMMIKAGTLGTIPYDPTKNVSTCYVIGIKVLPSETSVEFTNVSNIKIFGSNGRLNIVGLESEKNVNIYSTSGKLIKVSKSTEDIRLDNGIYIVKIDDVVQKVIME